MFFLKYFSKFLLRSHFQVLFPTALFAAFYWTSEGAAQDAPFFSARINVGLCRQFSRGARVEFDYKIGGSKKANPLPIENQVIDTARNVGTYYVKLPSVFGSTTFSVRAYCRNSSGRSRGSNPVQLSYCDVLKFRDSDHDGIPDNQEDTNCDNTFDIGDASNPYSEDSDGDGIRDYVEHLYGTDPANAGSSPRPFVVGGAPFDPDGDGDSNPVVWRVAQGMWFVRDFIDPGIHLAFQFGLPGDVPLVYNPDSATSNVGVVRNFNGQLLWILNGPGILNAGNGRDTVFFFGLAGDQIIPGPWETPGVTSAAVARLVRNNWTFYVLRKDGAVSAIPWGLPGDLPKAQDYDGDGLFDVAVFRPAEQRTYVIRSHDFGVNIYDFGSATADYTVRGDISGDGIDDLTFWEPATGMFTSLSSDSGFDSSQSMQLGVFFHHLPLSWNRKNGKILYTVVEHATGLRYVRPDNDPSSSIESLQWGLPGDAQG